MGRTNQSFKVSLDKMFIKNPIRFFCNITDYKPYASKSEFLLSNNFNIVESLRFLSSNRMILKKSEITHWVY